MAIGTDWSMFISMILDGAYELDIRKTGSAAMFTKNQLGASQNPHTETEKFKKSLREKIESSDFTPEHALANPNVYFILFELANLFLPDWEVFAMKSCSLYLQFGVFARPLSPNARAEKEELTAGLSGNLIGFIHRWKVQYGMIGMQDIYERYGFLQSVVKKWRLEISEGTVLANAHGVIGVIYLGEWSHFPRAERERFFRTNMTNDALFGAILSDMERLEGIRDYNYSMFAEDCRLFHPTLYSAILQRCKAWVSDSVVAETSKSDGPSRVIELFNVWTGSQRDLLDGSVLRNAVDSPKAAGGNGHVK